MMATDFVNRIYTAILLFCLCNFKTIISILNIYDLFVLIKLINVENSLGFAMTSTGMTIGSLETFESDDKLFSKHILKEGHGDLTANEGSVCLVHIFMVGKYFSLLLNSS